MSQKPRHPFNHYCVTAAFHNIVLSSQHHLNLFRCRSYLIALCAHISWFLLLPFDMFNWMWIFNQSEPCHDLCISVICKCTILLKSIQIQSFFIFYSFLCHTCSCIEFMHWFERESNPYSIFNVIFKSLFNKFDI